MTPEERALISALGRGPRMTPMDPKVLLAAFGASDGVLLGLELLRDAVTRRDGVDVEYAMTVCANFGDTDAHLPLLHELAFADWHQRHEDVAFTLAQLRSPSSFEALMHLVEWVPDYLAWDDARALASKAIWGLGALPGDRAREALERLTHADDPIVSNGARYQLELQD